MFLYHVINIKRFYVDLLQELPVGTIFVNDSLRLDLEISNLKERGYQPFILIFDFKKENIEDFFEIRESQKTNIFDYLSLSGGLWSKCPIQSKDLYFDDFGIITKVSDIQYIPSIFDRCSLIFKNYLGKNCFFSRKMFLHS